ncbi:MAG: tRNA lysidine(34) synthetase TilS [Nitrospinae bacterium]|nr:tRNA lysidine(34) synthetase TilS [Nitrospinota bacterium]
MKDIVTQVRETIRREKLLTGGEKVLVALSGGADSIALLNLLNTLSGEFNISLAIAHLNHSIRGDEADRDEEFVKRVGGQMGVETFTDKIDVPKYQNEHGLSVETAAREVRYKFLQRIAKKIGAGRIATGHSAEDQAETVLMRLLRGSGAGGLSGIPVVRGKIIRPLIDVRRHQIIELLRGQGIEYIDDSTNLDLSMTRNRLRHDLIPKLIQDYNPNIVETLNSTASLSRGEDDYLETIVSEEIKRVTQAEGAGFVEFNLASFTPLHIAIRRRLIRRGIEDVRGSLLGIGYSHIEEILTLIDWSDSPKSIDLPADIIIHIRYGRMGIYARESLPAYPGFEKEIQIPGETIIPEIGLKVSAEIISGGTSSPLDNDERGLEQIFDIGLAEKGLTVRNRRDGDRFSPNGIVGSKKIKDFLIDKKVCREERNGIPIFVSGKDIVWIAGYRRSSVGVVKDIEKGGIRLRITPL